MTDPAVNLGDVVRYGQHVTFTTLPKEGGEVRLYVNRQPVTVLLFPVQLSIYSDDFSFMKHSKFSREQEVTLVGEVTYKCAW